MKYTTKHIFIDTNIIEGNNFFHGSHFQSLLYYSRIGIIKLFMTSISRMELMNRMKKRLIEAKAEHNKLVKSLNKPKTRILKNFIQYNEIELSPIKIEESLDELSKKLEKIINSSGIEIIDSENVKIEEIFELFYANKPPFNTNEEKKYEFPDAFIIKSVDSWCKVNKKKMIFLTKDKDFNGYISRHLIFKDDLVNLLETISKYFDSIQETQIIPFIKKQLKENQEFLLSLVDEQLNNIIVLETDYERTNNIVFSNLRYHSNKITSIRKEYAEVIYFISVNYDFSISPSVYDIDKAFFEESIKPRKIVGKLNIPCDIEVNLLRENKVELKWVNSGQKIRIYTE